MRKFSPFIQVLAVSLLFMATVFNAHAAKDAPMNVLFIIVDDLSVDVASYGHPVVKTPNLDKLRARGIQFNNAYSQYPLCNPSRNSLLTSLYPGTSGNLSNSDHIRDLVPDVVTLPELFKKNGYTTITTGKVFHHEDPQSWSKISDIVSGDVHPEGKEYKFYRPKGEEGKTKGDGALLSDGSLRWFQWRSVSEETEQYLKDYQSANTTIRRIDELAESKEPFFLAFGLARPHDPFFAPKRFFDMYPDEVLELPTEPDDASEWPISAFNREFKEVFSKMTEQESYDALRSFYAGISYMDEQLGRVVDHFDATGLSDNALIVFMSDNGYHVGHNGYWNKSTLFERSCLAPLIFAAPGIPTAGQSTNRIVEFIDIYPTIAEICGLEVPEHVEGSSLLPLLRDANAPWDEIAYSYVNRSRSVRDDRFRYSQWSSGHQALWDHKNDPNEYYNLADNPEYASVVARMKGLIDKMPEPDK
ncbi:MAG: sulfatase [Opitutales bacterium]